MIKEVTIAILAGAIGIFGTIYLPQIKNLLGANPDIYYQISRFYGEENKIKPLSKLDILNDSNISGDLLVTINNPIEISKIIFEDNKTTPDIEVRAEQTLLKFESIYPNEEFSLILFDEKYTNPQFKIDSQTYNINKKNPALSSQINTERFLTYNIITKFLFFVVIIWTFYCVYRLIKPRS